MSWRLLSAYFVWHLWLTIEGNAARFLSRTSTVELEW